jgi:MoaA/NifB/PqqE/SkfB family radical SAM enzyme
MPKSRKTSKEKIRRAISSWKNSLCEIKDCLVIFFKYGTVVKDIRIDASSLCQLRCVLCSQAKQDMGIIGSGYLKFQDFKKFLDSYPEFKNIELSGNGEIFLNPELQAIIRYAYEKKVNLTAYGGVNLNTVSDEIMESLVQYRFKAISISLDGSSSETYNIYRREGNFDKVIDNIKKINYYKQIYSSNFPLLFWQFIIFGHNEHELPAARKMAEELNMEFKPALNSWDRAYSPIKDEAFVARQMGFASVQQFRQETKRESVCRGIQVYHELMINWDGKLLGCCVNCWADFGNVFESGLKNCLRNEKFIYAKKMLLDQKKARKDIACFHCPEYKKRQTVAFELRKKQAPKLPLALLELKILFGRIFFILKNNLVSSLKAALRNLKQS